MIPYLRGDSFFLFVDNQCSYYAALFIVVQTSEDPRSITSQHTVKSNVFRTVACGACAVEAVVIEEENAGGVPAEAVVAILRRAKKSCDQENACIRGVPPKKSHLNRVLMGI